VVDQLIQNRDERARRNDIAAGKTPSIWREVGTYYNYGVPIAVVAASAMNVIRGPWIDRLATLGGALAGRKVTFTMTKAEQNLPWRPMPHPSPSPRAPARRTLDEEFAGTGIV
jgi:hypothetical protein